MEKYLHPEVNPNISSKMNLISLQQDGNIYITKYSSLGFTLHNEAKLSGPTIFFPRNAIKWKIFSAEDINEKSLRLFAMLTPKLDILLIGTGGRRRDLSQETVRYLQENKVSFEVMSTDQAIATFNFQNNDQRWVAAALIPPESPKSDISNYVQSYYRDILDSTDMIYSEEKDLPQIEEKESGKQIDSTESKEKDNIEQKKVTARPNVWGDRSPLGMVKSVQSDQVMTVDREKYAEQNDRSTSTEGDASQKKSEKDGKSTDSKK